MEEKITFGKYILEKRKQAGLSQKNMAEQLYVTESAVSKWERGISYPDITLVATLCQVLNISEHELLTASDDFHQREIEKQAKGFRTFMKTYEWFFYIGYGISLISCCIINIALDHTLSWFFIVMAAELVAFSLTSLPLLVTKNRSLKTLGAFYISVNLLLIVCWMYSGGNWLVITLCALLLGFAVVFLPYILREILVPKPFSDHKTLLCMGVDTVLVFLLVTIVCICTNNVEQLLVALLATAVSVVLPWVYLIVIRYTKWNLYIKAAICLLISGVYIFFINAILNALLHHLPYQWPYFNLLDWQLENIDGNIKLIILIICVLSSIVCMVRGIKLMVKEDTKVQENE